VETIPVDDELAVRPFDVRDATALFDIIDANRDYLCRWLPRMDAVRSVADERAALAGLAARQRKGDMLGGPIEYRGRIVGGAGLHGLRSADRVGELGYWIAEEVQGRGIATRACRALLERAFGDGGMGRVEIKAAMENTRSRLLAERLGFRLKRILRRELSCGSGLHDVAVYSLSAPEWKPPEGTEPVESPQEGGDRRAEAHRCRQER